MRSVPSVFNLPAAPFSFSVPEALGKALGRGGTTPQAHRFDLLDEGLYQDLLADPSQFSGELRQMKPGRSIGAFLDALAEGALWPSSSGA